jgi:hypothetical protein
MGAISNLHVVAMMVGIWTGQLEKQYLTSLSAPYATCCNEHSVIHSHCSVPQVASPVIQGLARGFSNLDEDLLHGCHRHTEAGHFEIKLVSCMVATKQASPQSLSDRLSVGGSLVRVTRPAPCRVTRPALCRWLFAESPNWPSAGSPLQVALCRITRLALCRVTRPAL